MRPQRYCIFCGGAGLTKEHIWADWLKKYIPKDMPSYSESHAIVHRTRIDENKKVRSGDPRSRRLKVVCAKCNNGWMSRLQERAKPILLPLILGKPTVLSEEGQRISATWATMAIMVAEFFDPKKVAISQDERFLLRVREIPPMNWKIWIAHFRRGDWAGLWVHNLFPIDPDSSKPYPEDEGIPRPNTQTTTFVVGELYIHALSSAIEELLPMIPDKWNLLSQIWPNQSPPIHWPGSTLTDKQADSVAGAFGRYFDSLG
jgi:hypothetical protein